MSSQLCALVKAGANVNRKNSQGDTALVLAVQAGHSTICEYLNRLSDPAEPQRAGQILADGAPSQEQSGCCSCSSAGHLNSVLDGLGETVDINSTSTRKAKPQCMLLARSGQVEVLERSIEARSDLNCSVKEDDPGPSVE